VVAFVVVVVLVAVLVWGWLSDRHRAQPEPTSKPAFDAFAGGYPVPPPLGDRVPVFADSYGIEPDETDQAGPGQPVAAERGVG